MLEEKEFTMSMFLNNERRLEAKSEYYYMEAKRLDGELIAEQAKCLKFAATISRMQKKIDRLELSESTRAQFDQESG